MEVWAAMPTFQSRVQFVCVCVESCDVAHAFQWTFRFRHAVNAYVPDRLHMPRFGQLGCSGFIVADAHGRLVSGKTWSFLDYGPDAAFRHVETILDALLLEQDGVVRDGAIGHDVDPPPPRSLQATGDHLSSVDAPPSVGVPVMDEEHEECTRSMNDLLQFPTVTNLKQVLEDLRAHFAHEEELLKAYSFGDNGGGGGDEGNETFSALASHVQDHERILNMARDALGWQEKSAETGMCYLGGDIPKVAQKLAKAFLSHASTFDALYEGRIPSLTQ